MKIEKINNNQIKCTLSKKDLTSRQIKVSELAYGTAKAQELFKDMMTQANDEFGFELDEMPLMVEAIPLSAESIMLIITKVDNPEELEDKFTNLPLPTSRTFKKKEDEDDSLLNEEPPNKKISDQDRIDIFFVYIFSSLDHISLAATHLHKKATVLNRSTLYKDTHSQQYYLAIVASDIPRGLSQEIGSVLSEYGEASIQSHSSLSYFEEHFDTLIKDNALSIMGQL